MWRRDPRYSVLGGILICLDDAAARSVATALARRVVRAPEPAAGARATQRLGAAHARTPAGDSMQATTAPATAVRCRPRPAAAPAGAAASAYQGYQIIRRNGAVVVVRAEQDRGRADEGVPRGARHAGRGLGERARDGRRPDRDRSCAALLRSRPGGGTFHIEDVQDQVELGLMRGGHHEVARAYVLYRERRAQERAKQGAAPAPRRAGADGHRPRPARAARLGAPAGADRVGLRRPRRRRAARADPGRDASATCTTACRSTRSTRRRSWPRAR